MLVFVLALASLLTGCGGSEDDVDTKVPESPEAADNVVVRVPGTEGTAFSGTYGNIEGTLETVDETLGAEPIE
jgi:major membrane immunogen (membrane-anchored lipoprotein)